MWVWGSQGRGMQGLGVFSAEVSAPNPQPPWEGGSGAGGAAVGLEGLGISTSPIPTPFSPQSLQLSKPGAALHEGLPRARIYLLLFMIREPGHLAAGPANRSRR